MCCVSGGAIKWMFLSGQIIQLGVFFTNVDGYLPLNADLYLRFAKAKVLIDPYQKTKKKLNRIAPTNNFRLMVIS